MPQIKKKPEETVFAEGEGKSLPGCTQPQLAEHCQTSSCLCSFYTTYSYREILFLYVSFVQVYFSEPALFSSRLQVGSVRESG